MPQGFYLERELRYLMQQVVEQDFPEMLMGSGALVNISTEIPNGAKTYSYKILTSVGEAAILGNGSTDIPKVDAYVEERVGHVKPIADKYSLTVDDLESSAFANMSIDPTMAITAREIIERKFDVLGYDGDEKYNLLGWLNLPNVPLYSLPNDGAGSSTKFIDKTPEQVYRDLTSFLSATRIATRGTYSPQILTLPQEAFDYVMETPYPNSSTATGDTIGSFLLKVQSYSMNGLQSIVSADYLAGKGTGGTDVMMSHIKRLDLLKYHLVQEFEQRPRTTEVDLAYEVVCRLKTGGVQNTKPLSLRKAEGV